MEHKRFKALLYERCMSVNFQNGLSPRDRNIVRTISTKIIHFSQTINMLAFGINILQDGDMKQTSNPYEFLGLELHVTINFWMEVNSNDTVKVLLVVNNFWLFKVLYTNHEYMCVC
jgi:hypothetical protein